jgi:outer membrane receptor protein involved in Fe transport
VTHGVDVFVAGSLDSDRGLSAIYLSELAGGEGPCVDAHGAPRACDGVVTGRDGEVAGGVYGSLRTEHWALHAFASRRRKQSPTAAYQTLIGDAIETFDTRLYLDGSYHRATEHTDVVARASVDYYGYHGNYPFAVPPQDGAGGALVRAVNFDLGKSMWVSGELRGRYHVERAGPYLSRLELASGLELARASATQLNEDRGQGAPVRYLDRTDPQESLALSLHASGRAFDHLVGFAAVRADDQPRSFGLSVNPQGGVVLDGGDLGRIRASFARGLRAPNVYEQFFTIRESALGVLGPEHSDTRELSVERYLGEHVRLLLVGYRQQVRDLITLTPAADGGAVYLNQGWVRSIGVEGELEGRWDALRLHATYARQRSTTSAQVLPNSPSALATLMVAAPLAGGRGEVGVESWFIHHRQSFDGTAIAPQFMTDVVLTVHRVVGDVDASLGIANVFDQRGGDPGGEEFLEKTIPHDPRTVWLRLSVAVQP